jgi:hypothetical protein
MPVARAEIPNSEGHKMAAPSTTVVGRALAAVSRFFKAARVLRVPIAMTVLALFSWCCRPRPARYTASSPSIRGILSTSPAKRAFLRLPAPVFPLQESRCSESSAFSVRPWRSGISRAASLRLSGQARTRLVWSKQSCDGLLHSLHLHWCWRPHGESTRAAYPAFNPVASRNSFAAVSSTNSEPSATPK